MVVIDETWYQKPKLITERTNAGGVIVRRQGFQVLIALARDKDQPEYILPKGGVDSGESLVEGAKREIEEEAGFTDLKMITKLAVLQRLNFAKTRWLTTHYFLFTTNQVEVSPTEVERHAEPHWFPIDDLPRIFWPEQYKLILDHRDRIKALLKHM